MKHPVVSFMYLHVEQIPLLEELLSSNKEGLHALHSRYVLFGHESIKDHQDCQMFELLAKDIEGCTHKWVREYYHKLIQKHGKEWVDLLVIHDESIIRNKILKILEFAFDSVYKTNTIRVRFQKYTDSPKEYQSISPLLVATLVDNFDIEDRHVATRNCYLTITKRGKEDE